MGVRISPWALGSRIFVWRSWCNGQHWSLWSSQSGFDSRRSPMKETKQRLERSALAVTRAVGSPASIIVHTIVFIASFGAVYARLLPFDRMLLVLTTAVSLEAIYLAIFIQMTVNAQGHAIEEGEQDKEDEIRKQQQKQTLEQIHDGLKKLMQDVERLQKKQ